MGDGPSYIDMVFRCYRVRIKVDYSLGKLSPGFSHAGSAGKNADNQGQPPASTLFRPSDPPRVSSLSCSRMSTPCVDHHTLVPEVVIAWMWILRDSAEDMWHVYDCENGPYVFGDPIPDGVEPGTSSNAYQLRRITPLHRLVSSTFALLLQRRVT